MNLSLPWSHFRDINPCPGVASIPPSWLLPDPICWLSSNVPYLTFLFIEFLFPPPNPDSTQILHPSLWAALAKTHPPLPFLHQLLLSVGKLFMALHCPRQAPVQKYLGSMGAWPGLAGEPGPNPDIPCEQVAQPCRWKTHVERENGCWSPSCLCGYSCGLCSSEWHFSPVLWNCACFRRAVGRVWAGLLIQPFEFPSESHLVSELEDTQRYLSPFMYLSYCPKSGFVLIFLSLF